MHIFSTENIIIFTIIWRFSVLIQKYWCAFVSRSCFKIERLLVHVCRYLLKDVPVFACAALFTWRLSLWATFILLEIFETCLYYLRICDVFHFSFIVFLLGLVLVSLGCSMSFAFLLLEIFEACFCCLVIFYVFDFSFAWDFWDLFLLLGDFLWFCLLLTCEF